MNEIFNFGAAFLIFCLVQMNEIFNFGAAFLIFCLVLLCVWIVATM